MNVYDCFRILELPRNAGLEELKFAYRKKAKQYHPDRKGGDSRMFNRLHEAYSFLLDYGPFQKSNPGSEVHDPIGEAARRAEELKKAREAVRRAEEARKRREAEQEAAKRERERKQARARWAEKQKAAAEEKAKAEKQNRVSASHTAHLAGEVLAGKGSERDKIRAIQTLVSLKRKSVYPYLKKAFYCDSEKVVVAAIEAVGQLKVIQAAPEMASLMCSGSVRIRSAVLDAVSCFSSPLPFKAAMDLASTDNHPAVRRKAEELLGAVRG